jgi:hypothetical protein
MPLSPTRQGRKRTRNTEVEASSSPGTDSEPRREAKKSRRRPSNGGVALRSEEPLLISARNTVTVGGEPRAVTNASSTAVSRATQRTAAPQTDASSSCASKHTSVLFRNRFAVNLLKHNARPQTENINQMESSMNGSASDDGLKSETPDTTNTEANMYCTQQQFVSLIRQRLLLLLAALIISLSFTTMTLVAVAYAVDFNNNLAIQERDSRHLFTIGKFTDLIKTREETIRHFHELVHTLESRWRESQHTIHELRRRMAQAEAAFNEQVEGYRSIFAQHDNDLNEALGRINILRGNQDVKTSALEMAWQRMDELMEENNELSHHLHEAKKQQRPLHFQSIDSDMARTQRRDKELIYTVESLTQQLQIVSRGKDALQSQLALLTDEHELLKHTHKHFVDVLFTPIVSYAPNIQHASEQQHAIILELTSLVHSLHSTLDLSHSNLQILTSESQHAINAIANAASELAFTHAHQYEIERETYIEHMESQLERLEGEAVGATIAVAEAAGRLEYARKMEERTRWISYVDEVERTLGGIVVGAEEDLLMGWRKRDNRALEEESSTRADISGRSLNDELSGREDIIETSVLRSAISRRIEKGLFSLRQFVHPYKYLKENEERVDRDENQPED